MHQRSDMLLDFGLGLSSHSVRRSKTAHKASFAAAPPLQAGDGHVKKEDRASAAALLG